MSLNKISFIIPVLNEEKIIEKLLKYLSSYKGEKEIIVSDGYSTDKTVEIARKYARVVEHDGSFRQTIGAGRNAGAKIAKGDYFIFLDADVFIPDINIFLEKALKFFEINKKLVALSVSVRVFKENETLADKIIFSCLNFYNYFLNNIIGTGVAPGEFQMVKKEVFEKVYGYDEKLTASEDYDFFRRVAKVGKTYIAKDLIIYHTGRRAHKIGWPKLLSQWILNGLYVLLIKKSFSKEWKEIR